MPAPPLIDKYLIMCLLDELAQYGLDEAEIDKTLVRDGPVDLDLLAQCKREHAYYGNPYRDLFPRLSHKSILKAQ